MHISFPSEICSSEAYIGGISTDSLNFLIILMN